MNPARQLLRLLLIAVMVTMIASASFRMRPDKKAMRNSLVRFGKRAATAENIPSYPALIDDDTIQLENGAVIELGPFAYNDRLNLHRFYPQDFY